MTNPHEQLGRDRKALALYSTLKLVATPIPVVPAMVHEHGSEFWGRMAELASRLDPAGHRYGPPSAATLRAVERLIAAGQMRARVLEMKGTAR